MVRKWVRQSHASFREYWKASAQKNAEWFMDASELWQSAPRSVKIFIALVQIAGVPFLGHVFYRPHSLEECTEEMVKLSLVHQLSLGTLPDFVISKVSPLVRRFKAYPEPNEPYGRWELETSRMVEQLVRNRAAGKAVLTEQQKLIGGDGIVAADSFDFYEEGEEDTRKEADWRDDWVAAFNLLTGSLMLDKKQGIWAPHSGGPELLSLWRNSADALESATAARYDANGKLTRNTLFRDVFYDAAESSNRVFTDMAQLDITTGADTHCFNLPPESYLSYARRTVEIAVCLPVHAEKKNIGGGLHSALVWAEISEALRRTVVALEPAVQTSAPHGTEQVATKPKSAAKSANAVANAPAHARAKESATTQKPAVVAELAASTGTVIPAVPTTTTATTAVSSTEPPATAQSALPGPAADRPHSKITHAVPHGLEQLPPSLNTVPHATNAHAAHAKHSSNHINTHSAHSTHKVHVTRTVRHAEKASSNPTLAKRLIIFIPRKELGLLTTPRQYRTAAQHAWGGWSVTNSLWPWSGTAGSAHASSTDTAALVLYIKHLHPRLEAWEIQVCGYENTLQLNFPATASGAYTLLDGRLLIEEREAVGSGGGAGSASHNSAQDSAHSRAGSQSDVQQSSAGGVATAQKRVTRAVTTLPSKQGAERIQAAREHFQEYWVSEEVE